MDLKHLIFIKDAIIKDLLFQLFYQNLEKYLEATLTFLGNQEINGERDREIHSFFLWEMIKNLKNLNV